MLAEGVHLGNREAGIDQGLVEGNEVGQGDIRGEGVLTHGGGTAAEEKEDEGAVSGRCEKIEHEGSGFGGARGGKRVAAEAVE